MYKFVGEDNRQRLVTEDVIALVLTGTREIVSSRRAVSNVSTMKIKNRYVNTTGRIVCVTYTFILILFHFRTRTMDCIKKSTKENKLFNADIKTGVYGSLLKHTSSSRQYKYTNCDIETQNCYKQKCNLRIENTHNCVSIWF